MTGFDGIIAVIYADVHGFSQSFSFLETHLPISTQKKAEKAKKWGLQPEKPGRSTTMADFIAVSRLDFYSKTVFGFWSKKPAKPHIYLQ